MDRLVQDFLDYLLADRGYSPATIDTYQKALGSIRIYFKSLDSQLTWLNLDADVIRRWMAAQVDRGENTRTMGKELSALRSFYKYLRRVGRIDYSPVIGIHNPKAQKPLPTFLKEAEVNKLFDHTIFSDDYCGQRAHAILLTFYHTGIRMSELIGLNVEDLNLKQQELKVTGKRNKQRVVPFGNELADFMSVYLDSRKDFYGDSQGPLFLSVKKKRIGKSQVGVIVKKYLSLVTSQRKKSPHVLRHTFATAMLNNGASLEAIRELLGHESIATTEVYTHTTFADLKKEYQHAHPRA